MELTIGVFVWLLGLCVGSFLNVVVYRLPRDLSLSKPARSFCPGCGAQIAWHDNVPLLSWIWLRGACRACRQPISVQYPLVEAATGLAFLLVYHLLFVAHARAGLGPPAWPADAPLLLAWLALVAALVACSAMDLVSYLIDTRITNAALYIGVVCHAAWPAGEFLDPRGGSPAAAAAVAAALVGAIATWVASRRAARLETGPWSADPHNVADRAGAPGPSHGPLSGAHPPGTPPAPSRNGTLAVAGMVGLLSAVAVAAWLLASAVAGVDGPARVHFPVAAGLLVLFVTIVLAGAQPRGVDAELEHAIEEEAPQARRTAWRELLFLTPAVLAGAATYALLAAQPALGGAWTGVAAWPAGGFAPLGGVAYALLGAIAAAAAGWSLRLVFTLALGREAFGVGDIYMLAAAGACAGWDIALLGLLFSVGLALAGLLLSLVIKRSIVIPFGPWLALGFLAALWLSRAATDMLRSYYLDLAAIYRQQPRLLLLLLGVLLAASVAAVALARLLRRWIEPRGGAA
ncbi:MAG: prepilin peptidase [Phycisphaerae bacterium]